MLEHRPKPSNSNILGGFRLNGKIIAVFCIFVISLGLAVQNLFHLYDFTGLSDFFKEYQTWFGAVLAYFAVIAVGQPIVKIANDVQEVKEEFHKNRVEQRFELLEKIHIRYSDSYGVVLENFESDTYIYNPGVMVEIESQGDFAAFQAPIGMSGRFIGLKINKKINDDKLKILMDHSFDEIKTVTIFYNDGRKKMFTLIHDYQTLTTETGEIVLFRALVM